MYIERPEFDTLWNQQYRDKYIIQGKNVYEKCKVKTK